MATDLLDLVATLGIDTSPFENGLAKAVGGAAKLGADIISDLGKAAFDFGKDAIETGIGFDRAMSAVQAVLGKEEGTAENMADLRALALDQARQSVFTAEEMADAYYYMGMAGWKSEQMQKGLPAIWQLAAASGEDLARVSDIVTDSLTAFKLTADDAQSYVDILAQTATNSNTDVKRMGETFKYVAPIAGTLGYSVEDTALSIGLLASAGIKGSQAGTTLRNIFTRIATNAGATSKDIGALQVVSEKLGVSFYDAEGKARDWGDVLNEMRASWRGMETDARKGLIDSFNKTIDSGDEADLTLKEFAADVEEVQRLYTELNNSKNPEIFKRNSTEIGEIGTQYNELLKMLGIPIPDYMEGYAEALDQARIKLGMMSDQEKIYYSKQVGSMRGMAGFIRLLEATDEDLTKLVKSYENAAGAADAMSKTRLDNLGGDIDYLNAALDVMKIAVYDDVKGPLREVVQWAAEAINDITDAIGAHGLEGGIDMLGIKIEEAGEKFRPMLEALGKAAAPVIEALLTDIAPAIETAGTNLATGLLKGFSAGLIDTDNKSLSNIGGLLDFGTSLVGKLIGGGGIFQAAYGKVKPEKLKIDDLFDISGNPIPVEILPTLKPQDIYNAVSTAIENNEQNILIGDKFWVDNDTALRIANQLQAGIDSSDLYSSITNNATTALGDAGTEGGKQLSDNLDSEVSYAAPSIGDILSGELGDAGSDAGSDIVSDIQSALNFAKFTVSVIGVVSSIVNTVKSVFSHNASAMSSGRIYTKPTVFGYYNDAYQVAGDAGPEAVVGVNSLQRMITSAVHGAGGQEIVVPRNESRNLTVILELDRQQMGKAVYKLNNEETQRVGMKLDKGGAY